MRRFRAMKISIAALVLEIKKILPDSGFGRFSLQANQVPPYNAFVTLEALQNAVEQKGRANQILISGATPERRRSRAAKAFFVGRYRCLVAKGACAERLELRTQRVFLDPLIADAAHSAAQRQSGHNVFRQ